MHDNPYPVSRQDLPRQVYILTHSDDDAVNILGVFADLQDANAECLRQGQSAGVFLSKGSSTTGPDTSTFSPVEPMRWDTPEGDSCWVEGHTVILRKVVAPAPLSATDR